MISQCCILQACGRSSHVHGMLFGKTPSRNAFSEIPHVCPANGAVMSAIAHGDSLNMSKLSTA